MPALLLLLFLGTALAGCGQTGPLYPQPKASQNADANEQEGASA
jgi:predicted small lipoprotein YifL